MAFGFGSWRGLLSDRRRSVADYRTTRPAVMEDFNAYLLYWHEVQMRAMAGQYDAALPLLVGARMPANIEAEVRLPWNVYVDATMAFIKRDRTDLQSARNTLATLPSDYFQGRPPSNLNVVDGMLRCFDRRYAEATGRACVQQNPPR
jgi:hypothetical protein